MTTSSIVASEFVTELISSEPTVDMMIGIGIVKDSEAVFFQYVGEEQPPIALTFPSGKPCTRLPKLTLTGVDIAEDIGTFSSTKLNLYLTSESGRTLLLTSGLTTIWSQCVITGLMALFNEYSLTEPLTIDTWKGTGRMRPCFAAIRQNGVKLSDQSMYDSFADARSDRDNDRITRLVRDSVDILRSALGVEPVAVAVDDVQPATDY